MIPNEDSLNQLILKADLRKTTGYDYIPYEAMKYKEFRKIIIRDTKKLIIENKDTQPFFTAKLVLFNKNKSGTAPTVNQLRLIACTCVTQKLIETHLLLEAQTNMEQHLSPTQLGFVREGECMIHIKEAIKDIQYVRERKDKIKNAGFLFIDFQQAFDSVDHEILQKKIRKSPGYRKEWAEAVAWYLKQCQIQYNKIKINV